MKKSLKLFAVSIAAFMTAATMAGLASCGGDDALKSDAKVTLSYWNSISGSDSEYMQNLVRDFNEDYKGEIYVENDTLLEDAHYQRILTSFTDDSTADICLVHKSRLAAFERQGRLRDMTEIVSSAEISADDYVSDVWDSGVFDDKVYALPYDVLPVVLYYNRELIPEGYTEEQIRSDDFSLELMAEMMQAAYKHAPQASKRTYGIAFNYAYTEQMFLNFLYQYEGKVVEAENPMQPLYDGPEGVKAATALASIPFVEKDGNSVASQTGSDHMAIFLQGRALFTFDGIWAAPDACKKTEKCDAGVAFFPQAEGASKRVATADGHCFVLFKNKSQSEEKDAAISVFLKYLVEHSDVWCQGGKVAARADVMEKDSYKNLEWGYLSNSLENIISPPKVYTYNTLIEPIGKYMSQLCEGKLTDASAAIAQAAKDGKDAAEQL